MFDALVKDLRENHDKYFARDMQAADAIKELMRRCEQFQNMPPPAWIPVTDRLPDEQDEYLVLWKSKDTSWNKQLFYEILEFDLDAGNWVDDIPQSEPFGGFDVVYWMPLPELPKEG